MQHADGPPGERRSEHSSRAQDLQDSPAPKIANVRGQLGRRDNLRRNPQLGESTAQAICETGYSSYFMPSREENLFWRRPVHEAISTATRTAGDVRCSRDLRLARKIKVAEVTPMIPVQRK